jgi:hypothetical protein
MIKIAYFQFLTTISSKHERFLPTYRILLSEKIQTTQHNTTQHKLKYLLVLMVFVIVENLNAQMQCSSPWPSWPEYQQLISLRQAIYQNNGVPENNVPVAIPLAIHMTRYSNGAGATLPSYYTNQYADAVIADMNQIYSGSDISFFRLGDVNLLDYDLFQDWNLSKLWYLESYSYVPNALNVYVKLELDGFAPQPTQEVLNAASFSTAKNKTHVGLPLWIVSNTSASSNPANAVNHVAHEAGHTLALLHTHGRNNPYIYPATPAQVDYPLDNSVIPIPMNKFPRELAIRANDPTKLHQNPNFEVAGDLIGDTQADCLPYDFPQEWPAWQNGNPMSCDLTSCPGGCVNECPGNSSYRDYNGDWLGGNPENLMSYHCGSILTPQQKMAAYDGYQAFWSNVYTSEPINLTEKVDFMDTNNGIGAVTIKWEHTGTPRSARSFTNFQGNFQGVLYQNMVKAKLRKLGSTSSSTLFIGGGAGTGIGSYLEDRYTATDWRNGVMLCDVTAIQNHILGLAPMNGWQQLAADANKSHTITSNDIIEFKKLILGAYSSLPNYTAPWRFIPEYIPSNYLAHFNYNPFAINQPGINVTQAQYTEPTWLFNFTTGTVGNRGFDAVHLGDINNCVMLTTAGSGSKHAKKMIQQLDLIQNKEEVEIIPGNEYVLEFRAKNALEFAGFQSQFSVNEDLVTDLVVTSKAVKNFHSEENPGFHLSKGQLRLIFVKEEKEFKSCKADESLFELRFKATAYAADIHEVIRLDTTDFISAIETSKSLDQLDLEPILVPTSSGRSSELLDTDLRIYPNPISNELNLVYYAEKEGAIDVQIFNAAGALIYQNDPIMQLGWNHWVINPSFDQNTDSNFLILRLNTNERIITTKIMKK